MKKLIIRIISMLGKPISIIGLPLTFLSAVWLKITIVARQQKLNDPIYMKLGILPIIDHYYQPLINPKKHLRYSLRNNRNLPGIDFNDQEQLELLKEFHYNEEVQSFTIKKETNNAFFLNNNMYSSGDAEYLYNIIRKFKPKRLIEIGSGYSTMVASSAIRQNKLDDESYSCRHICYEPYEREWIAQLNVEYIKQKIELVDLDVFRILEANDILFIDSSHIVRPQGDVLYEYLEILPILQSGVLVHLHDIFTPKDYPDRWIYEEHVLWNEQYLLEAFMSFNSDFRIIGSLNYLAHKYCKELSEKCPFFAANIGYEENKREPRAFWIMRN